MFVKQQMRSFKEFINDIIRKPPLLFPIVGLFHILWLVWTIWDDRKEPLDLAWLQVLWMAGYTFFWIAICDLKRWGAMGYFVLTILNTSIYLAARNHKLDQIYISTLFLVDGLFSFFVLVYYKRLRR